MKKTVVSVLIPNHIKNELLYVSDDSSIGVGNIVVVPLRNTSTVGVVWSTMSHEAEQTNYNLKEILYKVQGIELNKNMRGFIDSIAKQTLTPRGLVLKLVLSTFIKRHKIILKKLLSTPNAVITNDSCAKDLKLSEEQYAVFTAVLSELHKHKVTVIDGITGSGKTELYLQIAKTVIENYGQVLILLPEILLTTQIIERAQNIFGCEVYSWHSNVKQKDKDNIWIGVQNQSVKVVIGARSALFLPFTNLKMIIVDEEHDISFKQETNPIYNAKNIAILRAKIFDIPILLASATPSIETMFHVQQNHYKYFHLNTRNFNEANLEIKIANMWELHNKETKIFPILHTISIDEISKTLESKQQILIFLNRKGYAGTTICTSCMSAVRCKNCDIKLTYYKYKKHLKCRHCGYIVSEQKTCSTCGNTETLCTYHPGIERLNEELIKHFPDARIITITRETFETEDANLIIQKICNNEVDIIIGTQILAKGLHFPKMRLCVIVDANNTKFSGDIRSLERSYQILQQVIGRVGRESDGLAIIQTLNNKSPIINSIASGNKKEFIELELENRKKAKVPPYGAFILINISSKHEQKLHKWLLSISIPNSTPEMKVFGPIPAAIHRMHNKYRYQILFKGDDQENLINVIEKWLEILIIPYYITLTVDVDPQSFY
jgi:primosomal protein N' (replication factor Y)